MKEQFSTRRKIAGVVMVGLGAAGLAGCGHASSQAAPANVPRVANYLVTGTTSERQPDGSYETSIDLSGCLPFSDQGVSGKNKKDVGQGIYYGRSGEPDGLLTLGTGYRAESNGIQLTGAAKVLEQGGKVEGEQNLYGDKLAILASQKDIGADLYTAKAARTFGVACTREVRIDSGAADYNVFDPSKGLNGEVGASQPTSTDVDAFYEQSIVSVSKGEDGKQVITVVAQPHAY